MTFLETLSVNFKLNLSLTFCHILTLHFIFCPESLWPRAALHVETRGTFDPKRDDKEHRQRRLSSSCSGQTPLFNQCSRVNLSNGLQSFRPKHLWFSPDSHCFWILILRFCLNLIHKSYGIENHFGMQFSQTLACMRSFADAFAFCRF